MSWSQDEERMLAMIERHLTDEDPRLAARLESFNERVERGERNRRRTDKKRRRWRRSTVVIAVSWLLIATLIATLLVMAFHNDAAAVPF
ncbi:DUF3040 domain-containing protein [Herbidospora sp. NEAU-GS84]|uniref:DUF3040 domain-containing protein n=1 Tax=Herbidospora solisilvae TaxID=2696284 RepID=A0A7C9MXK3_9ACTN|nr:MULTISPECIES: DUF3040 domain-containing protein [Herbidospora]NAS20330.1 DUF3040 domain-containing protein [Herbidospora solisilvae]GLX93654.1 hypothetical protein Hesp01_16040 [Herbidospora sp. NBRC 101105]